MFEATPLFAVLSRALDDAALRQAVHTSNIANASTEGFRRLAVTFDSQLLASSQLDRTDASSWTNVPSRVVATDETVRLDQEMALMAKDAVRYQALLGAFERTTSMLSLAIHEGRGA